MPLILNALLSPTPDGRLNVNVSPASTSVADKVPITALAPAFSATELLVRLIFDGVSLTFVTSIVNTFSNVRPPASVTRTVTE